MNHSDITGILVVAIAAGLSLQVVAQNSGSEAEEKILERMLERRTFTSQEIAEIDQNNDGVIDVRDLVLSLKSQPSYAFFTEARSTLVLGVKETANLEVSFSQPFSGELRYRIAGNALPDVHYMAANGETVADGVLTGTVNVNGTTATIPIAAKARDTFTGMKSMIVSIVGYRGVASETERLALTPADGERVRQESDNTLWEFTTAGGWSMVQNDYYDFGSAAVHRVDIHEADRGLYSGRISFQPKFHLPSQLVRVAVRSDGTATFDVSESTLFPEGFSVSVQLGSGGNFAFSGADTGAPRTLSTILGREVTWQMSFDEPEVVATVADEDALFALTNNEVSNGDLVVQSDVTEVLQRVMDETQLDTYIGWITAAPEKLETNVFLTLPSGLTATQTGTQIFGILELVQRESPLPSQ